MPEHIRFFLDGYSEDIQHIIDNQQNTDETILQQWEALLSGDIPAQKDGDVVVGPLLGNNRWNQTKYYNDLCPEDASGHVAYGGPELPDAIGEHCLETLNVYPTLPTVLCISLPNRTPFQRCRSLTFSENCFSIKT